MTARGSTPTPKAELLHLPRILCFHGGGTNARIFRTQCRVLRAHLAPFFRLVFADAPFPSQPGPDVESVYAQWGPFRSWVELPSFTFTHKAVFDDIDDSIAAAVSEDDAAGATGPWVGLLGFSQGAKVAASLLLRQQSQCNKRNQETDYRFAVLLAGRGPLLSETEVQPGLLQLPTIHVHGLRDDGLEMHRQLHHDFCKKGSTRLVEWDGDHRVPIKSADIAAVVAEILDVASKCGL